MSDNTNQKADAAAAWKLTTLFIVIGALIFGIFWFARTNNESATAYKLRQLLGIFLVNKSAPAPAPVVTTPEPASAPQPETELNPELNPEPEPEPVIVEVEPEPVVLESMTWSNLKSNPVMWPDSLNINVDKEAELRYRGNIYGEVSFSSGQYLEVLEISAEGFIRGRINGTEMEVHATATNFRTWFEEKHGDRYEITIPKKEFLEKVEDYEEQLIADLRIWTMQNYGSPLIEIGEDNLILRLQGDTSDNTGIDFSPEAHSIARAYLRIQAELGGTDTYASCEIVDLRSGRSLGSKGIFIPRF